MLVPGSGPSPARSSPQTSFESSAPGRPSSSSRWAKPASRASLSRSRCSKSIPP